MEPIAAEVLYFFMCYAQPIEALKRICMRGKLTNREKAASRALSFI
jgi:hypothetical protein